MSNSSLKYFVLIILIVCVSCDELSTQNNAQKAEDSLMVITKGSYSYDAEFLRKNTSKVLELVDPDGMAKVLLSADYQGRVMTSTAMGDSGTSFGWLNYNLIGITEKKKQFNPVGGEERFWLGPEGGQYSIYFKAKDSFDFANWQVPAFIDTDKYDVSQSDPSSVIFSKAAKFTNYSGTNFNINIERKVTLLTKEQLGSKLHVDIPGKIHFVGFESTNSITNTGDQDWTKDKGLLSIWLLGMFTPTPKTMVIIPFSGGAGSRSYITDNYFGKIPAERLQVTDSVLYFMCDGKYRSKIGLSPLIAKPIAAGFDFEKNVLTIIVPTISKNESYVNSKWELQKDPYKGDVINSYNDGPLADGTQMGPFFEIESSSAALSLKKGQKGSYAQTTCHFQGDYNTLKELAMKLLGIDLDMIKNNTKNSSMHLYKTSKGIVASHNDKSHIIEGTWDDVINQENLFEHLVDVISTSTLITEGQAGEMLDNYILAPVGNQEVWAAGVTYLRSRDARMEESEDSGAADCYSRVYEAERPELFFKSLPHRVIAHGQTVNIRKDSTWNVPEPELALYINSKGNIQAYTIGNDMSSRSIEGENPLYLPQAKMYEGSASLGPGLYIPESAIPADTSIKMNIIRNGEKLFDDGTSINRMKRSLTELAHWLYLEFDFPYGCFLMTGTCVVPPNDFTLQVADEVNIDIEGIGRLTNLIGVRR